MYCPKCGMKLSDDNVFCSECGTTVKKDAISQTSKEEKIKRAPKGWVIACIIFSAVMLILTTVSVFEQNITPIFSGLSLFIFFFYTLIWFIISVKKYGKKDLLFPGLAFGISVLLYLNFILIGSFLGDSNKFAFVVILPALNFVFVLVYGIMTLAKN